MQSQGIRRHRAPGSQDWGFYYVRPSSYHHGPVHTHGQKSNTTEFNNTQLQNEIIFCKSSNQHPSEILFHLIDHLFECVFVRLPEDCKRTILRELWKLVSHDIILDLKPHFDQWSKEGLCEAFRTMEKNSSEFCTFVLTFLVNFKKEPFIIDVTVHFVEQHYQGFARVSKAVSRIIETSETGSIIHRNAGQSLVRSNSRTTQRFEFEDTTTTTQRFLLMRKQLILTLIISVAVTAVSCYGALAIYCRIFKSENEPVFEKYELKNGSAVFETTPYNTTIKLPENTETGYLRYYLTVSSYDEYKNVPFKLMHDREITLKISFENNESWPLNFVTGNTHMITELEILSGPSSYQVLYILHAMKNAVNITITNRSFVCQQLDAVFQDYLILSKVEQFVVEDFADCYDFYNFMSDTVILNRMHMFQISNAVLTQQSTNAIKKLISNSRDSLKSIEFINCKLHVPLFERYTGTYQNVKLLRIDFPGDDYISQISPIFHNVFPKLKTFISNAGFVVWEQFLNFAGCSSLEYLKIGIEVSAHNSSINLLPVLRYFRKLKTFDLFLNFVGKNGDLGCKIIGLEDIDRTLSNFTYRSNCHVDRF